jgi:MYXO-CTERM domain-containing protein
MRISPLALAICSFVTLAPSARAFCGFYVSDSGKQLVNAATQVALMRDGTRTVLSMQNDYEGPPERFAMIVPVPVVLQKENVKTLPRELFAKLEQLDAPRLVEYWEQDPCAVEADEKEMNASPVRRAMTGAPMASAAGNLGVRVEAQFAVGEYEIVILSAESSNGLDTWLRQEHYNIPAGAEPYLRPYVAEGSRFFVAKVDPQKVKFDEHGQAALSPLRFHYDADSLKLPVRLGLINSGGKQDLIVHLLARGKRYEVANYPNVTIPTNLDVEERTKTEFGSFYANLFDETLKKNPGAVVTEYSWDASSCDPCPGPSLTSSDLATLGADVLPNNQEPSMYFGGGFTLTRIHARYDKTTLGSDLVFRTAPAIVGGREFVTRGGAIEHGAVAAAYNNFQARYAIRHPWTGAIACEHPRRGVWGGPPAGQSQERTESATNLAFAKRDGVQLASFVTGDIPEIGFLKNAPPVVTPVAAPSSSASATPSASSSGCAGCATADDTSPAAAALFVPFVIFAARRRRR